MDRNTVEPANLEQATLRRSSTQRTDSGQPTRDPIAQALSTPFAVMQHSPTPVVSDGNVFVHVDYVPGKTKDATLRALRNQVRSARDSDQYSFHDDRFLTTYDLERKSGEWPHSAVSGPFEDGFVETMMRQRFVLCRAKKAVGFVTMQVEAEYEGDRKLPQFDIDLRSVFIAAAFRAEGLSHLLAEAVVEQAMSIFTEFQRRLIAVGAMRTRRFPIRVTGEPISDGGERFQKMVVGKLRQRSRASLTPGYGKDAIRVRVSVDRDD